MGTYKKGILGAFSGKVGTVIGSSWRGIDYLRSLPKPSTKAPTDLQLIQRARFGMVTGFLIPISSLLNLGYKNVAINQTGYNMASAQVLNEAIIGVYPDLEIDYSKVLISRGNLTGAWNTALSSTAGEVTFTWQDNTGSGLAKADDMAILLIYNPVKSSFVFTTDGAARSALIESMQVPADFAGDSVHTWIAFISANKKILATSIYAGQVVVS